MKYPAVEKILAEQENPPTEAAKKRGNQIHWEPGELQKHLEYISDPKYMEKQKALPVKDMWRFEEALKKLATEWGYAFKEMEFESSTSELKATFKTEKA